MRYLSVLVVVVVVAHMYNNIAVDCFSVNMIIIMCLLDGGGGFVGGNWGSILFICVICAMPTLFKL